MASPGKLMLIDGNSLLYRAFFALPPLQTAEGVYTNAVYGFLTMLFRLLEQEKPSHVAVTFDKGPSFRKEDYAAYKAQRQQTPDELRQQFPVMKEILTAMGIAVVEAVGRSGRCARVDMVTALVCAVDGAVVSALVADGPAPRETARATLVDVIDVLAPIDDRM